MVNSRPFFLALALSAVPAASFAAGRVSLSGTVTDAGGKPLEHATVLVYHAGVKHGYSTLCPSCYVDCGRRALTDSAGKYTIQGLSDELIFELLIVHDGYVPQFVRKTDPAASAPVTALPATAGASADPHRILRGLVVDSGNHPLRDAVVQPQGVQTQTGSHYGGPWPWLQPIAVTNDHGEFELMATQTFDAMVVQVEARGMAARIFTSLNSGVDRHKLTLTEGGVIRGRLVQNGRPVPDAEIGLVAKQRAWGGNLKVIGYPMPEIHVGTNADGTFAITNVAPEIDWYLYGKMESLGARGGAPNIEIRSGKDGQEVNAGDLRMEPAFHLRGRVVLPDGKHIPPDMRVMITSDRGVDTVMHVLGPDGDFDFGGLAAGDYSVVASVKGYDGGNTPLTVRKDTSDLVLTLNRRY